MPLLHKKAFIKKKVDPSLKPGHKVFFCELTEEIFIDYDEFWERLVLLNALVWTCELTGRPNLTYQEAIESEFKARKCISNVPLSLKRPMMYISTFTKRSKILDMSDDIFNFIRDRYFVGEEVEAIVSKHWYDCKVTKVILPTPEEIELYEKELAESEEEEAEEATNGKCSEGGDDDDDIQVLRDDHQNNTSVSESNNKSNKDEEEDYPPFPTVKYEVVEIEPWDYKECKGKPKQSDIFQRHVVSWDQIRRSKSSFTREKCKLFVKQCVKLNSDGYWTLKEAVANKYGVKKISYSDIFVGRSPKFPVSIIKKSGLSEAKQKKKENKTKENNKTKSVDKQKGTNKVDKKQKQSPKKKTIVKENKKKEVKLEETKKNVERIEEKKKPKPMMSEEEKEEARKRFLAEREKKQEELRRKMELVRAEKKKERDLQKEEKRLMTICKSHWDRKREDLECDDHKDLPAPTPIVCRIPNQLFGDFAMVLEFLNAFTELLELNDVYPNGINFDMLEHALVEKEVAGVFNDIVQLLLGAVFSLQEEEDEEIEGDTTLDMASMNFENNLESKSLISAVQLANKAATWSQQYQGASLQKVPLDALTLTEVIRLHLLASGANSNANAAWRHANRGGYKNTDDPGLQFKLDEPEIIKKLTSESIFDLTIGEKMKILNVLVTQILTYASVRDSIDEKLEKVKESTNNLKLYRYAEMKKEREEGTARRQRERDEKKKQMTKKTESGDLKALGTDGNSEIKPVNTEPEEEEDPETEEEKALRLEREEKNRERRKNESLKKEKEFLEKIQSLSQGVRQCQLGQDRAYRRFWIFHSLPGLFVEDLDPEPGTCLEEPTPVRLNSLELEENQELKDKLRQQAIKNISKKDKEKEAEKNSSDKENDNNDSPKKGLKQPAKKLLQAPNHNIVLGTTANDHLKTEDEDEEEEDKVDMFSFLPDQTYSSSENMEELHSKIFGLCSSNALTCPVHSTSTDRPKWSFYYDTSTFESLLDSLNSKGVRESELKESLTINKDKVLWGLQNCPAYKLDPSQEPEMPTTAQRKSERNTASAISSASSNLNFPPGTAIEKIMELTLRDMILEVEEKLDSGLLGALKVHERDVWRNALVEGTSLSFSNLQDLDYGGRKRIKQLKIDNGLEMVDDEDIVDSEDLISKDGLTPAGVLKELAIAILQVAQSVEHKYVKAPLAESEKKARSRQRAENRLKNQLKKDRKEQHEDSSSEDEDESFDEKSKKELVSDNTLRTPFERWEKSLMACTSFSQIFLHLATLDNSITWSRSAVNARCSLCKRKSDPENMLLCDDCDRGYHLYCLKPQLKIIPTGDWFCDKCKPKVKTKSPRKQRKIYTEVESDEDEQDEEESEEESEQEEFVNHEYCDACEMGGEIICCDTCPRSFHPDCADLRKIPRGDWSCPFCKEEQMAKLKNKKRVNTEPSKKAKKRSTRKVSDEDYENEESCSSKRRGVKRSFEEMENEDYHGEAIESLLGELSSHEDAWPFVKPVARTDAPDYYDKIKKPIDLKTIKIRFNKNKYTADTEFIADVLLIFSNCQQYFSEKDPEFKAGTKLSKYFLKKVKAHKLSNTQDADDTFVRKPSKRKR